MAGRDGWRCCREGRDRVTAAYLQAFGREPTATELRASLTFFEKFVAAAGIEKAREAGLQAMSAFCQALKASAEFRTLN